MFLIICFGVLIICMNVILQSTFTVHSLKYLHKFNFKNQRLSISHVLWQMALSVSLLTLLHGAQCTIWAAAFYFNPNIDNLYSFQEALYFSFITFTTVGYGDVVIDSEWKILAGLGSYQWNYDGWLVDCVDVFLFANHFEKKYI